jgi:hypothetical protein
MLPNWVKSPLPGERPHLQHSFRALTLTDRPEDAGRAPSPFAALRDILTAQIDDVVQMRSDRTGPPTLAEHERMTKTILAIIKTAGSVFAEDAKPPKSAEEIKREDDAIRDEFARRLAAMLRGQEARGAPAADAAPGPPEASS